jgi:hypothetical protein
MSEPQRTDDLVQTLGELGKMAVPVEDGPRVAYRRERLVRLLGTAISAEGKRSRRRHLWPWLAVAAASVLALGGVVGRSAWRAEPAVAVSERAEAGDARSVVGEVSVRRHGEASALHVGELFVGGELLSTSAGSTVEIGIASGRTAVAASSELEIMRPTANERRLRLGVGSVDVDLPHKLEAGKHLVVETPDVDVLVVGTAFTVDVGRAPGAASTRVRVRRGTVWIMRAGAQLAVLNAGDDWSSATKPAPAAAPAPREVPVRAVAAARTNGPAREAESGTLREENRLFKAGLTARNNGDNAGAADAFATLLSRYPRTVLREQALAEQFRSLERAGRSPAATVAARRYLASYPNGFARADAERLTSGLLPER